jgi:cobalt-zinc-cadmium efflux system protein
MPHDHEHKHAHSHHHAHGSAGNIRLAFFLNLSFTVIELVGGLLTNSIAIISDAVHDFGDSLSLGLAWYFQCLSKKGKTKQYSYGYKRFSLLGAIINSVVLVVGSVLILSEAVPRILAPQEPNTTGMLILAVVGIAVNGLAALRTRSARSINERVVSLHMLEDVLGWAAVLAGSIIIRLTGLSVLDPILSVLIAAFVIVNVFRNIRQVLPILLQGAPAEIDSERIVQILSELEPVASIHDLHIWSLDEQYNVLTLHAALKEPPSPEELAAIKSAIRERLRGEGIQHATIELEGPGEDCGMEDCI